VKEHSSQRLRWAIARIRRPDGGVALASRLRPRCGGLLRGDSAMSHGFVRMRLPKSWYRRWTVFCAGMATKDAGRDKWHSSLSRDLAALSWLILENDTLSGSHRHMVPMPWPSPMQGVGPSAGCGRNDPCLYADRGIRRRLRSFATFLSAFDRASPCLFWCLRSRKRARPAGSAPFALRAQGAARRSNSNIVVSCSAESISLDSRVMRQPSPVFKRDCALIVRSPCATCRYCMRPWRNG